MRLYQLWFVPLACVAITTTQCASVWAEAEAKQEQPAAKAEDKPAEQADEKQKKQDVEQKADEEKPQRIRARVPKHQAKPNPQTARGSNGLLSEQEMFMPESAGLRRLATQQQAKPQQQPAQQAAPADQLPQRPPYWSPRRSGISPSAAYRLGSMGTHVQLSPSLQWHVNRSQGAGGGPPNPQQAAASSAPGQGAEKFYPGVSRLPAQKPFANLDRGPSGLESYWPWLLEGRQDPNTGLIIWSLP